MAQTLQERWQAHPATTAPSIPALIARCAAAYGAAPALSCEGQSLSYRQLDRLATQLAAWFQQVLALPAGARVALLLPNVPAFAVVALAALRAGLVLANFNPHYSEQELRRLLQDSGASVLVGLCSHWLRLEALLAGTELRHLLLVDSMPGSEGRRAVQVASRRITVHDARAALQHGQHCLRQHGFRFATVRREDLAVLQYTSGTTAEPRAACLSHGNLLANVAQLALALGSAQPGPGSSMLLPLPLYHSYAFSLGLLAGLVAGHELLLVPDPRDPGALLRCLQGRRLAGVLGVDPLYRSLCAFAPFAAVDFGALQLCSAGGMALSERTAAAWLTLTGCPLAEGYGLSECAPLIACNTPQDLAPGTVGRPVPYTRLRLVDARGHQVPQGQQGEICMQGPQLMQGYWQRPQASAQAVDAGGWFHTGDIGVLDADGRLRIVDRLKDLLIGSGFKVCPGEVEAVLCRHPAVREACLVGMEADGSTRLVLFVVPQASTPDPRDLIAWCRQQLAPYKVPRQVEFRSHLPRNALGKVLRRDLRASLAREGQARS